MRPAPECGTCIFHWAYQRTAPYVQEGRRAELAERISDYLFRELTDESNVGGLCNRVLASVGELVSAARSFYDPFKERSNRRAAELLPAATAYAEAAGGERARLERACAVAAAANVAPLGAPSATFSFPEATEILEGKRNARFLGDLHGAAAKARRILYVVDNAGEIGFDTLVVRLLKGAGARVTLVVKDLPFFEDARREDATFFGFDRLADEILTSPGFLVPSEASPAVARAFDDADLVIAKGTGAYEALRGEVVGKASAFLLKVKCRPIARETGSESGTVVVCLDPPAGRPA
ncbi:MAG: DUF89 family protein [Deltaproteobacteria bacterium]|nr:DUF89 family protein [Deltaproteobacteria bacterium]